MHAYRLAAITDKGERFLSDTREEIDRWCAERAKEGRSVSVYAKLLPRAGKGRLFGTIERVGQWEPLADV